MERNKKHGQPDDLISHDLMEINKGGVAEIAQSDQILKFFCLLITRQPLVLPLANVTQISQMIQIY